MGKRVEQLPVDLSSPVAAGTPTAATDATHVDSSTTPSADSGVGSPGSSKLASPADHVHPASGGAGATWRATFTQDAKTLLGLADGAYQDIFDDFADKQTIFADGTAPTAVTTEKGGQVHPPAPAAAKTFCSLTFSDEPFYMACRIRADTAPSAGETAPVGLLNGNNAISMGLNGDVSTSKWAAWVENGVGTNSAASTHSISTGEYVNVRVWTTDGSTLNLSVNGEAAVTFANNIAAGTAMLGWLVSGTAGLRTGTFLDKILYVVGVPT